MRLVFLFSFLALGSKVYAQQNTTDTSLYNANYYLLASAPQQANNFTYEVVYTYQKDPNYKMRKVYLDSAQTKLVSRSFSHQAKLHGPYESYAMGNLQAKGFYKTGKLDGERITYYQNAAIMEKAFFKNGKRTGTWEYFNTQGVLKRKVTYDNNGAIANEELF